ncbi:MAG: hypothetical protein ACRD0K_30595 [Egibacteraceae bacterium]
MIWHEPLAAAPGVGRLAAAVRLDLRLEWRYGAVAAAGIAAAGWVAVLTRVPASAHDAAVPLIVFVDSGVVGLFFSAMVLFEKGERTLRALVATPLRFEEYLASKLPDRSPAWRWPAARSSCWPAAGGTRATKPSHSWQSCSTVAVSSIIRVPDEAWPRGA